MSLKAAASLLFALAAVGQAVEIRLATFNIGAHFTTSSTGVYYPDYSLGSPGGPDFDSVRDILDRIDADVVALEEIHSVDISGNRVSALAANLGYPYVFIAPSTNTFDTSLHVAFLSRFPFLAQTSVGSPAGAKEMNRLIPSVKVDVPGTIRDPLLVAAHLKSGSASSDKFQRTVEMRRLTGSLTTQGLTANDNFVIMGDFNLSDNDQTFTSLPASGLPTSFILGSDITFPVNYFTNPVTYFSSPTVTRMIPRQLDNSIVTFPSSGSTIDLFLVSPLMGTRPVRTEIYNSTLDTSNASGLAKAGSPLTAGTSATASDHFAMFGNFELDPPIPYTFHAPGETVSETFTGFPGTYDPYPWVITGGTWQGTDGGSSNVPGFRAYGSTGDPSLGFLASTTAGSATASFVNQSTHVLSTLGISFTAEQWRSSLAGTADTLSAELIVGGVPQPLPQLTFQAATNLPNGPITGGASTPKSMTVSGLSIAPGATFQLKFTFAPEAGGRPLPADVFINEFDYDDLSTDSGEFVEVVTGPGYTGSLAAVSLSFYRADGNVYATHSLSTFTPGDVTSTGHRIYSKAISGIQNGPNGIAVVVNGVVTQFISYEGQFTATAGAANGLTSTNIGVSQSGNEPEGESALGLTGTGGTSSNFYWTKFTGIPYSPGQPNSGQTFTVPPQPQGIAIDNLSVTFVADSDGDGFTDADEAVFGTNPQDANSRFTMTFAYPAPPPGVVRLVFPTLTGRNYAVQGSTDLSAWTDLATYPGTGAQQSADLPVGAERFYRIRVTTP